MGRTLDEPQSVGQGSDVGRSGAYGGLSGIRSGRRNDGNDHQPDRRHGQSVGRRKKENFSHITIDIWYETRKSRSLLVINELLWPIFFSLLLKGILGSFASYMVHRIFSSVSH